MNHLYDENKAFRLYIYYLALKQHFTTESYDYFKYNGKVNAKLDTFRKRKDRFFFYKLSNKDYAKDLIFANVIYQPKSWIGDLTDEDAHEIYVDWKRRRKSLTYLFKEDLSRIDDLKSDLKVSGNDHPPLLKKFLYNQIMLETMVILNHIIKFFPNWMKKIDDSILLPDINKRVNKYEAFLSRDIDISKYRKILVDKYKNTT